MLKDETKKKMMLICSILYRSNVSVEEGKIIGHFIEELVKENEKLNHYKLLYQKVKERNDKAVEYIEELYDNTDDITCYDIDRNTRDDLLVILKGNNDERITSN